MMCSPRLTSFVSGVAAAVVIAIGSVLTIESSSTPEPLPLEFIVLATAVAALVSGVLMAFAVRGGLYLASSPPLAVGHALIIPAVSLVLMGILMTTPMQTQVLVLELPSREGSSVDASPAFWLTILGTFLIPVLVSCLVGRFSIRARR